MPAFDPNAFDIGFDVGLSSSSAAFGFGFDPFDSLMISVCSVLTNQASASDSYGQKTLRPQDFSVLATNVPCRVSDHALGRPHESKVDKKMSDAYSTMFMRPPQLSDGSKLNPHHWILLTGSIDPFSGTITPLADGEQIRFNIFDVLNPSRLDHHYELIVQRVIA